ncbi:uncharacterized protein AAES06_015287 [Glossophaga mutica]
MVYIDVWVDIATDRPGYIRRCQSNGQRKGRALCVATAPRQTPRLQADKGRRPQQSQENEGGRRLYPVLPEVPEDPLLAPSVPPPYHQPLPDSSSGRAERIQSPPHTRGGTQYGEGLAPKQDGAAILSSAPHSGGAAILPLREVPPAPDAPLHAPPRLIYVPFSTSDLYNWKLQNPPFSEKPQGLISLLETIFRTHQPTWDDCQQILQTLFTSEERDRIMREAVKAVMGEEGETAVGRREVQDILPEQPPNWDPNTSGGRDALLQYRRALLRGLKIAAKKPTNFSKVSEVVQGREESPASFLERLIEAYRVYTPLDPQAPENRRLLNIAFVTQAAPDVRKKLQKN